MKEIIIISIINNGNNFFMSNENSYNRDTNIFNSSNKGYSNMVSYIFII